MKYKSREAFLKSFKISLKVIKDRMKNIRKSLSYFIESRNELLKVVWPDRKTTLNMTIAVIIISGVVAIFLGAVDFILLKGLTFILK